MSLWWLCGQQIDWPDVTGFLPAAMSCTVGVTWRERIWCSTHSASNIPASAFSVLCQHTNYNLSGSQNSTWNTSAFSVFCQHLQSGSDNFTSNISACSMLCHHAQTMSNAKWKKYINSNLSCWLFCLELTLTVTTDFILCVSWDHHKQSASWLWSWLKK